MCSSVCSVPRNIGGGRFLSQVERHLGFHFRQLGLPANQNVWVSAWLLSCLSLDAPTAASATAVNVDPAFALTVPGDSGSHSKFLYCLSDVPRLGGARDFDNALAECTRLHIPLTLSRAICGPAAVFRQLSAIMRQRVEARQPTSPFWIPVPVINDTSHEIGASVAHERIVTVRGAIVSPTPHTAPQQGEARYEPLLQLVNACDVRTSHHNETTGQMEEVFLEDVLRQRHPVIVSDGELTRRSDDERRLVDQVLDEDVLRLKWIRHKRRLRSEYWCTRDAFAPELGSAAAEVGVLTQRGVSVRLKDGQSAVLYNMDDVQTEKTDAARAGTPQTVAPPLQKSIAAPPRPPMPTSSAAAPTPRCLVAAARPQSVAGSTNSKTCATEARQEKVGLPSARASRTTITLTLSLKKEQVDTAKLQRDVVVLRSRDGSVTIDLTRLGCSVISWRESSS